MTRRSIMRRGARLPLTILSVLVVCLIMVLVWWCQDDAGRHDAEYSFLEAQEFFVEISSSPSVRVEIFSVSSTGVRSVGHFKSPPSQRFRAGLKQASTEQYAIRPTWTGGMGQFGKARVENKSTGRDAAPPLKRTPKYYCLPGTFSPDGATLALCAKRSSERFSTKTVVLLDVPSMSVVRKLAYPDEYIRDLMWSEDGQMLIVLVAEFSHGRGPLDTLSAMSGHPVAYYSYFIRFIRMEDFQAYRIPIKADVRWGVGKLRAR